MNKKGKTLNLKNIKEDILDTSPTSEYFGVSELGEKLTSGKNSLSINGSSLLLKNSEILVEVVDVNGFPLYIEVAKNQSVFSYREGTNIVIAIHVYADTPIGTGNIYIIGKDSLGRLVKWTRRIEIDTSIQNKSPVRFYKEPSIEVTPFINPTSESDIKETWISAEFIGKAIVPEEGKNIKYYDPIRTSVDYRIIDPSGNFSSEMNGQYIYINFNTYLIQEVITSKEIKINYPVLNGDIVVNSSGSYEIKYFPYNSSTYSINNLKRVGSAEIIFKNIETFTGKIYRYKIYRSSLNAPYDSECISIGIFYGNEILYDSETPLRNESNLGKIISQEFLDSHWFSLTEGVLLTHTPDKMIDSFTTNGASEIPLAEVIVKTGRSGIPQYIEPTDQYADQSPVQTSEDIIDITDENPSGGVGEVDDSVDEYESYRDTEEYKSNFITIYKNVEYRLKFKISTNKNNTGNVSEIKFKLIGSDVDILKNKNYEGDGISIYKIDVSKTNLTNKEYDVSFTLESDFVGTMKIQSSYCDYTISNISITPYTDFSYGPDVFTIRIPYDARTKNEGNIITVELFDVNNNLIIGNLKTIQYFDPAGITYPFNKSPVQDELDLSIFDLKFSSSIDAAFVTYNNPNFPTVELALNHLLYEPISTSYFNGGGTYEIGSVVNAVSLNWDYNKSPTTQSIDGSALDIEQRSYVETAAAISSNKTYTLSFTDGVSEGSSTQTILFMSKRYWGVSSSPTLTDREIIALSSEFSSNRAQSRKFNCSGGKYFYFIWPSSFGLGTFNVFGLFNNDFSLVTRNFTNSSGYTSQYNIYRCNNIQYSSNIEVTVS